MSGRKLLRQLSAHRAVTPSLRRRAGWTMAWALFTVVPCAIESRRELAIVSRAAGHGGLQRNRRGDPMGRPGELTLACPTA